MNTPRFDALCSSDYTDAQAREAIALERIENELCESPDTPANRKRMLIIRGHLDALDHEVAAHRTALAA